MIVHNYFLSDAERHEIVPMDERSFPHVCIETELDRYADKTIPWHWHNAFEIEYLAEGTAELCTPDQIQRLNKGDMVFVNAGVLHQLRAVENSSCLVFAQIFEMHFLSGMYHSVFEEKYFLPVSRSSSFQAWAARPNDPEGLRIIQTVVDAIDLCREEPVGYEFALRDALCRFWLRMLAQVGDNLSGGAVRNAADLERIKTMMEFVQSNCSEQLSLRQIARSANVSERECTRCFRRCIDASPIEYLMQCRIRLAARLLTETGKSVLEISEETGFSSASYFGRVFRQAMGCTPKEYRKANGRIVTESSK